MGLGELMVVRVENLQELLNRANCVNELNQRIQNCQEQKLALFLNDRIIEKHYPEAIVVQGEEGILQFHLKRSKETDETWSDLVGNPPLGEFFELPVKVSVGLEKGYPVPTDVTEDKNNFKLIRMHINWFLICMITNLLLAYLLWRLAKESDILRVSGPQPTEIDERTGRPKRKPFSLASCQMVFWFFLVIISYVFIWFITNESDILTPGVLGLMGIGSGTALLGTVIDSTKKGQPSTQIDSLKAEKQTLENDLRQINSQLKASPPPPNLGELQKTKTAKLSRLALVDESISQLSGTSGTRATLGLLRDLVTDSQGEISFHRFQMFAWTIVLGIIFVYSVREKLAMPDFSATLLTLQGISAGTFLGFKTQEKEPTKNS